jgi:hypothetical protein
MFLSTKPDKKVSGRPGPRTGARREFTNIICHTWSSRLCWANRRALTTWKTPRGWPLEEPTIYTVKKTLPGQPCHARDDRERGRHAKQTAEYRNPPVPVMSPPRAAEGAANLDAALRTSVRLVCGNGAGVLR